MKMLKDVNSFPEWLAQRHPKVRLSTMQNLYVAYRMTGDGDALAASKVSNAFNKLLPEMPKAFQQHAGERINEGLWPRQSGYTFVQSLWERYEAYVALQDAENDEAALATL